MKKITSLLLTLILTLSLSTVAFATDLSFSDVPSSDWAYPTIMRAVELGLFQGTKEPDTNGVGHFNSSGIMTRAEFLAVCVRATGNEAADFQSPLSGQWYDGYWKKAKDIGIITSSSLSGFDEPITREEMACYAISTLSEMGEFVHTLTAWGKIPDIDSVTREYKDTVYAAYSLGILRGVDDIGTFAPQQVLTRAEAATVAIRLVDKSYRRPIPEDEHNTAIASHEWNEGERHELAKAGDVVIKKDGTKVVLEATVVGHEADGKDIIVLGVNQGVDFWTGTVIKNVRTGGERILHLGSNVNGWYRKSDTSKLVRHGKEVHSEMEWGMITKLDQYRKPTKDGIIAGQIANTFWQWNDGLYNPETGLYGAGFWALRDAIN